MYDCCCSLVLVVLTDSLYILARKEEDHRESGALLEISALNVSASKRQPSLL